VLSKYLKQVRVRHAVSISRGANAKRRYTVEVRNPSLARDGAINADRAEGGVRTRSWRLWDAADVPHSIARAVTLDNEAWLAFLSVGVDERHEIFARHGEVRRTAVNRRDYGRCRGSWHAQREAGRSPGYERCLRQILQPVRRATPVEALEAVVDERATKHVRVLVRELPPVGVRPACSAPATARETRSLSCRSAF
jgi:hypothetical protein